MYKQWRHYNERRSYIYYGDSTQVNAIDHKNYGEFLKHTEKKQELPGFDA